jgi:hypothetical protein
LTKAVHSVRRSDAIDPLWSDLKSHLVRNEGFPELLTVLAYAEKVRTSAQATRDRPKRVVQAPTQQLLIDSLNLCAVVLRIAPPHVVDAQDALKKAIVSKEANHLRTLGKALAAQQFALKMVALRVIGTLVRSSKRARATWDGLGVDAKVIRLLAPGNTADQVQVLSRLLGTRRANESPAMSKPGLSKPLLLHCTLLTPRRLPDPYDPRSDALA